MAISVLSFVCLLSATGHVIFGFPYGAPTQACEGMSPDHGSRPQTTESKFRIRPSAMTYCPKNEVNLTLTGEVPFRGFICQARPSVDGFNTSGSLTASNTDVDRTTTNCAGKASLTHKDATKKSTVSFTWTPDRSKTNLVYIVCTFVEQKLKYWVKQNVEIRYAGSDKCTPEGDVKGLPTNCTNSSTCNAQFSSSVCDTTADADGECICPSNMEVAHPTHTYCSPKGLPTSCSDSTTCDMFFSMSVCDANADADGQCVCPSNMKVADASHMYCSPKVLDDACTSNTDCSAVTYAECIGGFCKLNVCASDTDCTDADKNQCVQGKCTTSGVSCAVSSILSWVICGLFLYYKYEIGI